MPRTHLDRVSAYVRLARLDHGIMACLAVVSGALASGGLRAFYSNSWEIMLGCAVALLVEAGVFAFNDIFNVEEDRINAPWRPLVTGSITLRDAKVFAVATLVSGAYFSTLIGLESFIVVLLAVSTSMLYNYRLKREGFLGNVIVAFNTALPFIYGAVVVGRLAALIIHYFAIAFLAMLGREVIKGIRDVEGDRRVGLRTLAIVLGLRRAGAVASVLMMAASFLTFPVSLGVNNPLGYWSLVSISDIVFVYSSIAIALRPDIGVAERLRKLTLVGMLTGILGFAAAGVP